MEDKVTDLIRQAKESNPGILLLNNQDLKEFPKEICSLTDLRILDLSENSIQSLPAEIQNLTNLVEINASKNQIVNLPAEIGKLSNLKRLSLQDNPIQKLPSSLKTLKLELLDLQGCKLNIPPEILARVTNTSGIIEYYFSSETLPLREAKVILVGQGSTGKTSLKNRLIYNTYNPHEEKTDGIAISEWEITVQQEQGNNPETIRLNVWDFGGQEIMHATHQFFLTKRSLYLLVCNARNSEADNRLDYWLKIIRSFGGDSPIIIVGNQIDEQPFNVDRRRLLNKYPQVKAILETSCRDGIGIPDLSKAITGEIGKLPHIFDPIPKKWFAIKDKLSSLKKNYLSFDDYKRICKDEGVLQDFYQYTLIGFLHDLGTMIYFQDDPHLQELGILNPEWVTNAVYRIINSNLLFKEHGILSIKDLESILESDEYTRSHYAFIVNIMQKFELCYPFDNDTNRYLIPDLLIKDEPETGDWKDVLAFQYKYSVLPSSVFSRFIVRMHPFISKNTVWHSGVVLKIDTNRVRVKADFDAGKIIIEIDGVGVKRDILQQIRSQFESIHKTIPGLDVVEQIPIPEHPELSIDYKQLLKLESNKVYKFPLVGLDESVDVRQLLNGVVDPASKERQYEQVTRKSLWKSILTSPKYLGHFLLDLFDRSGAKDSTALAVGWIILVIIILIWADVFTLQTLESIWRFFFPLNP